MSKKHTYGYDPFSHCWIVGLETDDGTIAERVDWFADAAEARARAEELNAESKD